MIISYNSDPGLSGQGNYCCQSAKAAGLETLRETPSALMLAPPLSAKVVPSHSPWKRSTPLGPPEKVPPQVLSELEPLREETDTVCMLASP